MWYDTYTYYIWASVEMGIIHSQNGGYLLGGKFLIVCPTEAHNRENMKFIWISYVLPLLIGTYLGK